MFSDISVAAAKRAVDVVGGIAGINGRDRPIHGRHRHRRSPAGHPVKMP
jgi:hypothetical protein